MQNSCFFLKRLWVWQRLITYLSVVKRVYERRLRLGHKSNQTATFRVCKASQLNWQKRKSKGGGERQGDPGRIKYCMPEMSPWITCHFNGLTSDPLFYSIWKERMDNKLQAAFFLACKSGSKVHPFMSVSAKRLKFTNSLLSWSSIIIATCHRAPDPDLVQEQTHSIPAEYCLFFHFMCSAYYSVILIKTHNKDTVWLTEWDSPSEFEQSGGYFMFLSFGRRFSLKLLRRSALSHPGNKRTVSASIPLKHRCCGDQKPNSGSHRLSRKMCESVMMSPQSFMKISFESKCSGS